MSSLLRDAFSTSKKLETTPKETSSSYEELMLGVWRVLVVKDSFFLAFDIQWDGFSKVPKLFLRVCREAYAISPRLFAHCVLGHCWSAIEKPLALYISNRLLFFIEKRISGDLTGDDKPPLDLYLAVIFRVASSVLSAYARRTSQRNRTAYSARLKYEYQARLFSAKLARDLPSIQEQDVPRASAGDVYRCLDQGIRLVNEVISFLLHLHLILHIIGGGLNDGGPIFVAICMLPSILSQFSWDDLWSKAYVVNPVNKFFIRKSALEKLAGSSLRQEVMAACASEYLIDEYQKAKDGLGDTPDSEPEFLYSEECQPVSDILTTLCSDGPTFYFAFLALFSPSKLSIVQLAVLNEASTSLHYTFSGIRSSLNFCSSEFSRMMNVYVAIEAKNSIKDGEMPFPRPGHEKSAGMGIQVRDVSFSYPKTKSEREALTAVSFAIQPGQLVVIVGANGSGKSTIIKLLSRFYEPNSGSILIDGIPIEEYRMDELRKGIAMLTQEHQLFPLSVRENIQLGSSDAEAMKDLKSMDASVSAAGAESVIKNFSEEYDTVLEPVTSGYVSYAGRGNKELEAINKSFKKPTSISGGEKQKLVAARTFMRLFTSPVKLVTVDEPSSALDPEAEYRLFTNLRKQRHGRTMIFVTHRFGHLTKHADLIICMKEGAVVETGTHADLLSRGGEYAHLYNVQAQAFATA